MPMSFFSVTVNTCKNPAIYSSLYQQFSLPYLYFRFHKLLIQFLSVKRSQKFNPKCSSTNTNYPIFIDSKSVSLFANTSAETKDRATIWNGMQLRHYRCDWTSEDGHSSYAESSSKWTSVATIIWTSCPQCTSKVCTSCSSKRSCLPPQCNAS